MNKRLIVRVRLALWARDGGVMSKFAAVLLVTAALIAPAAAQAGTAVQGFADGTPFGALAVNETAGAAFGAPADQPLALFGAEQPAASGFRYSLVTPATLAAGQDLAGARGALGDGTDVAGPLLNLAVLGTATAATGSGFAFQDTAPANATGLVGKFSFRTIASRLPEPATWVLMILGFGAIGGAMRFHIRRSEARFTAKLRRIAAGETA